MPSSYSLPKILLTGIVATVISAACVAQPAAAEPGLPPISPSEAFWHEMYPATGGGSANQLTADADGAVWYADDTNSEIVRIDANTRLLDEFDLGPSPTLISSLLTIADGSVWYAELAAGYIGHIDPIAMTIRRFPLPATIAEARSLTLGSDGAVWFATGPAGTLGRIDSTGAFSEVVIGSSVETSHLTADNDGRLWLSDVNSGSITRFDPRSRLFDSPATLPLPNAVVTRAADGGIWAGTRNSLAHVAPDGATITHSLTLPGSPVFPRSLTTGVLPYAQLYFTDTIRGIGVVDAAGGISFIRPPAEGTRPTSVALAMGGDAGELWFFDSGRRTIGWAS